MNALTTDPPKRWFTVRHAASTLGMSRQTLWRRIRSGDLAAATVNGQLVIPSAMLERLRADGSVRARAYGRRCLEHGSEIDEQVVEIPT